MSLFGGKSRQLVGLDIGSSSIKAVELKSTKAGYELVSFGMETLAPDTVVDGAIMDAPQVANAISKIFEAQRIKTKNVATSVSGHSVIVKRVPLPLMTEEELYDRIPSEASQHIPFDIADVNLSYQLLESMDSQMDVLLVAVKKDKILNHTNVLAQAGKTPTIVDIDAFALQNCFEVNYEPDSAQTVALLNIGASVMNINIVRGGIPLFTRDVSVGGNQYTDALQKELDLSFEDAERLKKGDTLPSVTDDQRQQILRSVSDILTLEIQKTFDFFRAPAPSLPPQQFAGCFRRWPWPGKSQTSSGFPRSECRTRCAESAASGRRLRSAACRLSSGARRLQSSGPIPFARRRCTGSRPRSRRA